MKILYYDRGGGFTEQVHIHSILTAFEELGHTVLNKPVFDPSATGKRVFSNRVVSYRLQWPLAMWRNRQAEQKALARHKDFDKPDIIYARHYYLNGAAALAKRWRVPLAVEVNGIVAVDRAMSGNWPRLALWLTDRLEKASMQKADRVVVLGWKLRQMLIDDYGIPEDRLIKSDNGVDVVRFQPLCEPEGNRIIFVGNLWQAHGVEYALRAMPLVLRHVPDASLMIVGNGVLKHSLEQLAIALRLSCVRFTGYIPPEDVPLYISKAAVCVAPLTQERNGLLGVNALKLAEYAACGRPVVVSDLPEMGYVREKQTGILVKPNNVKSLSDAIVELLLDKGKAAAYGANGRQYAVECRSWQHIAQTILKGIEPCLR